MTYIRFPKGKGFSVKGKGFSVKWKGFSVKGKVFSVKGKGFSVKRKGFSVFQTDRTDPASIQAGFLSQRTKGESKSDSNFISTPTGWPYVMLLNCALEQMVIGHAYWSYWYATSGTVCTS
jgi:hypothetical protein